MISFCTMCSAKPMEKSDSANDCDSTLGTRKQATQDLEPIVEEKEEEKQETESKIENENKNEEASDLPLPSPSHPLHRNWSFFVHYPLYTSTTESYNQSAYHKLCEFQSVENFWRYYEALPRPSTFFGNQDRRRLKLGGRDLEGLGIFLHDVCPEWEKNSGRHCEIGGIVDLQVLDAMWETLCLAIVGENVMDSMSVIGARVVDKAKAKKPLYRLEVWVSSTDKLHNGALLNSVMKAFVSDAPQDINFKYDQLPCVWKNHPKGDIVPDI
jgi:translation initiation factor 4E